MFREAIHFVGKRHFLTNLVLYRLYVVSDAIVFWGAVRTEPATHVACCAGWTVIGRDMKRSQTGMGHNPPFTLGPYQYQSGISRPLVIVRSCLKCIPVEAPWKSALLFEPMGCFLGLERSFQHALTFCDQK